MISLKLTADPQDRGAAELIRKMMFERRIKQADLARLSGKSRSFISEMLAGKRNVGLRTLAELAVAMGCEIHLAAKDTAVAVDAEEDLRRSSAVFVKALEEICGLLEGRANA